MSISDKAQAMIDELVSACIAFGRQVEPDWQTRIDKAQRELREYIDELEAENAELKERAAMLDVSSVFKSLSEMSYIEQVAGLEAEYSALPARIAELKNFINQLIEAGESEDSPMPAVWLELVNDWKECEE